MTNNNNKMYLLICFLSVLLALVGCSGIRIKQKNIYKIDEQIANEADTYSYLSRVDIEGFSKKTNQVHIEFSKFYGTDTIWRIESNGNNTLELSYKSEISKGKFKLVLVTEDEEVVNLLESSDEGTREVDIEKGTYRLKFVGQNAKGKVFIDIEENSNIELEKYE